MQPSLSLNKKYNTNQKRYISMKNPKQKPQEIFFYINRKTVVNSRTYRVRYFTVTVYV